MPEGSESLIFTLLGLSLQLSLDVETPRDVQGFKYAPLGSPCVAATLAPHGI